MCVFIHLYSWVPPRMPEVVKSMWFFPHNLLTNLLPCLTNWFLPLSPHIWKNSGCPYMHLALSLFLQLLHQAKTATVPTYSLTLSREWKVQLPQNTTRRHTTPPDPWNTTGPLEHHQTPRNTTRPLEHHQTAVPLSQCTPGAILDALSELLHFLFSTAMRQVLFSLSCSWGN